MALKLYNFSFVEDTKSVLRSLGLKDDREKEYTDDLDIFAEEKPPQTEDHLLNTWPQVFSSSLSPFGDLLVLSNGNRVVFLTSKWSSDEDTHDRLKFTISTVKDLSEKETLEKVSCLLCLPLMSKKRSHHTSPDWTCLIVGFSNGTIKAYTETGAAFWSQNIFENVSVKRMHYDWLPSSDQQLLIVGGTSVVIIDGFVLIQTLKACRNQLVRARAGQHQQIGTETLCMKRFNLIDSPLINDSCIVGGSKPCVFDHLVGESLRQGPSAYPRLSIAGNNQTLLTAGESMFLGLYNLSESGRGRQDLTQVAHAVASKLKTMMIPSMGNRLMNSFLGRSESSESPPVESAPTTCTIRYGFFDKNREGIDMSLSPNGTMVALVDNHGRVIISEIKKGICLRLLKGYRDAQCGWLEAKEEDVKDNREDGIRKVLYLVIYSPKRGILELWLAPLGHRIAAFNVSKSAKLLYCGSSVMGLESSLIQRQNSIDLYECCLMEPNGNISVVHVNFKNALELPSCPQQFEEILLKELGEHFSSDIINQDKLVEIDSILHKLRSSDALKKGFEVLLSSELLPEYFLRFVALLNQQIELLEENVESKKTLLQYVSKSTQLTQTYQELSTRMIEMKEPSHQDSVLPDLQALSQALCMSDRDAALLLSLTSVHSKVNSRHKRVSFAEEDTTVPSLKNFLEQFDITEEGGNSDLNNVKIISNMGLTEEQYSMLGMFIFGPSFKSSETDLKNLLISSGINPQDLIICLLCYWLESSRQLPHWSKWVILCRLLLLCAELIKYVPKRFTTWQSRIMTIISSSTHLSSAFVVCSLLHSIASQKSLKAESSEWEKLSDEWVDLNILLKRLEDLVMVDTLLKSTSLHTKKASLFSTSLSVHFIMSKGAGAISETIAEWIVSNDIPTKEFLVRNKEDTELTEAGMDKGLFEACRKRFPRSLDADALLANVCWEQMVSWRKEPDNVKHLELSIKQLKGIQSVILRNGVGCLMWKSFILPVYEALALLIEKVGKMPKERLCKQELRLSCIHIASFLEFCLELLEVLVDANIASESEEESLTPFPPDELWRLKDGEEKAVTPLVVLASRLGPATYSSVYHHFLLTHAMLFIVNFQIKNSRPLTLYDGRAREGFFQDFQQKDISTAMTSTPFRIVNARAQFLQRVISSIVLSIPDTIPSSETGQATPNLPTNQSSVNAKTEASKWMNRITAVAKGWDVNIDQVYAHFVCQLYSAGHDELAEEAMSVILNKCKLGSDLLKIAGQRVSQLVSTSPDQAGTLSTLSPTLSAWIQRLDFGSLKSCSISIEATKVLIGHAINSIPEEHGDYKLGLALFDSIQYLG